MSAYRVAAACLASIPLGLLLAYFGLLAGLTIIEQVFSQFIDVSNASLTSFVNPAVLLGIQSPGGTGGLLDAIVGGPGAPGGTTGRYFVFMAAAAITYGLFMLLMHIWSWAKAKAVRSV